MTQEQAIPMEPMLYRQKNCAPLDGQVYLGCINPAGEAYRKQIMEYGLKVGRYLASRGVIGHFSCDFIATKLAGGSYDLNAIEINLRQGGTTHPEATMALLCGGCVCSDGVFRTNDNEERCYIATDNGHPTRPVARVILLTPLNARLVHSHTTSAGIKSIELE